METKNNTTNAAHAELIKFINPKDSADIAKSLRNVFNKALFCPGDLACKEKDDLFVLSTIIDITEKLKQ